jgi:hypothetical protein
MIHARSNSDFDVQCATIQFYGNSHNSQFDNYFIMLLSKIYQYHKKKEKRKKIVQKKMFIGFYHIKLKKGKLDQVNSKLC